MVCEDTLPVCDIAHPPERTVGSAAFEHPQESDVQTGADKHWYLEVDAAVCTHRNTRYTNINNVTRVSIYINRTHHAMWVDITNTTTVCR